MRNWMTELLGLRNKILGLKAKKLGLIQLKQKIHIGNGEKCLEQ